MYGLDLIWSHKTPQKAYFYIFWHLTGANNRPWFIFVNKNLRPFLFFYQKHN